MRTVIIHGAKVQGTTIPPRRNHPGAELWGTTRCAIRFWGGQFDEWDEWHDYHPLVKSESAGFEGLPQRRPDEWRWLLKQDGRRPVYLQAPEDHHPKDQEKALRLFNLVPGARRLPIRDYLEAVGQANRYLGCQASMMILKACVEGVDKIILNGIGQPENEAHQKSHRCILYWLGFARGRGVEVVHEGPSTFRPMPFIYAYDHDSEAQQGAL